jgi:thioredoxin reductase (NADPH)
MLLAIGRRGTPRKLGIVGEELNKVVYSMIDPSEYSGKKVCVVGGGDSALEAAHTIAEEPGAEVLLSYRSAAFSRAKRKNREKIDRLAADGVLRVVLESQVAEIGESNLVLAYQRDGKETREIIDNDAVIVCVGGILPTGFLKEIGIEVETKYGTA